MVPAGKVEAVTQVSVRRPIDGTSARQQFDLEGRIHGWGNICKLQIAVGPPVHYAEVEFLGVPRDRLGDVGDADACVIALYRCKRARRLSGRESVWHAQLRSPSAIPSIRVNVTVMRTCTE